MGYLAYLNRIFSAYVLKRNSQLTFWHEDPNINPMAFTGKLGQYYMLFGNKANYGGPFDKDGVPLLDYQGGIGKQYNPIAVAQYALGNYNCFKQQGENTYYEKFISNAEWLVNNLQFTRNKTYLWPHNFDFEYFKPLISPWFSGLAQGQGLSVLVRAFAETNENKFLTASRRVFESLSIEIKNGGVIHRDGDGYSWIEEYLVNPPTHILNGFIWALWGVYDYYLLSKEENAKKLFDDYLRTILHYLPKYDIGFWSLYELTPQKIKSIASHFYHRLHIVQLDIMHRLTGHAQFSEYKNKWEKYQRQIFPRGRAHIYKIWFKLVYY